MIVAKVVGSFFGKAIDQKYFGGALSALEAKYHYPLLAARLAFALRPMKKDAADKIGPKIVEAMREAVPEESGALRESIRYEDGKIIAGGTPETMKAFAGGVFDEALGVEYGTTKMPAQPFFWPTIDQFRDEIEANLGREIESEFS